MTVCIAAIHKDDTIITASDRKVSFSGYSSAEKGMMKFLAVRKNWIGMIAGDDISHAIPVLKRIECAELDGDSLKDFSALCADSYKSERTTLVESEVLGKYDMKLPEFKKSGRQTFSEREHERIVQLIEDVRLGSEFLFAGFDQDCPPHILTVTEPGVIKNFDRIGYWAIGSGTYAALGALASFPYDRNNTRGVCAYQVMAAKLVAEAATDVGRETYVSIFTRDGTISMFLSEPLMKRIRNGWGSLPRMPEGIDKEIEAEIASLAGVLKKLADGKA